MTSLTIRRPDDFHLHLRDGAAMASIISASVRQFARAIVMPNLLPPVVTVEQALAYRERILACLPEGSDFTPLMTLYLTDNTALSEIQKIAGNEHVHAVKYYPAGATTNSDQGVTHIEKVFPVLEKMMELGVPLLVHGEVTDPIVDIFDREKVFIEKILSLLVQKFAGLKLVFEHITTRDAVQFVMEGPDTLAATITPQHLMYNRNALFKDGIRPHYYCLPVLKAEQHRRAVVDAAVSGHPRFFLGTDSAPHSRSAKENSCGCAGVFSAPCALEFYAEMFEQMGALDKLEAFASIHGAEFYGLEQNSGTVTLSRTDWVIPESLPFADEEIIPFNAGLNCSWKMV